MDIKKVFYNKALKALQLNQNGAIQNIKRVFKSLSPKEILALIDGKEELYYAMVEEGVIYVKKLFDIDNYSFSILELTPDSKIVWHLHRTEMEYYIVWRRNYNLKPCLIGEGHSIENNSQKNMYFLSVKVK